MYSRRRAPAALVSIAMIVSMVAIGATPVSAGVTGPRLRLVRTTDTVTEHTRGNRGFWFDPGVYVASLDADLEVWASRPDYNTPMSVVQQLPGGGAQVLPDAVLGESLYNGMQRFLQMKVVDRSGDVVVDRVLPFCPNTWNPQRIDDSGSVVPTYPDNCGYSPFTLGMVWGIDQGWAANVSDTGGSFGMRLRPGRYAVDLSIAPLYAEIFDVAPADGYTSLTLIVKRRKDHDGHEGTVRPDAVSQRPAPRVPIDTDPDPSTLPDLIALPSFGIDMRSRNGHDTLSFGANVWVSGAAPLVVEGFRQEGATLMDAFQYFYDGDTQVGRAPVGSFEYDPRHGHTHWHFRQFATYELLDADKTTAVVSEKEAFCLAPTDAIDLTLPGATYRPWPLGLDTACGGPEALWIREVLPLGWGDTYYQGMPGQAFDVTDLPNGMYYIKVQANPGGHLYEQRRGNNIRLREVRIRGRVGHRRVIVPAWHGIDTEGTGFGPTRGPRY